MDTDGSGNLDEGEMHFLCRKELKLTRRQASDADLGLLWEAIDDDNSGLVTLQEFAEFMRRVDREHLVDVAAATAPRPRKKTPKKKTYRGGALRSTSR